MDFKELVTLYFERTNAMQTLWSIYITIVLGLLGFLASAKLAPPRLRILLMLLVAFCGFAFVNCSALRSVTNQRNIAANLIRSQAQDVAIAKDPGNPKDPRTSDSRMQIAESLDPPSVSSVTAFHVAGDVLVIFAIFALGLRQPTGL